MAGVVSPSGACHPGPFVFAAGADTPSGGLALVTLSGCENLEYGLTDTGSKCDRSTTDTDEKEA